MGPIFVIRFVQINGFIWRVLLILDIASIISEIILYLISGERKNDTICPIE